MKPKIDTPNNEAKGLKQIGATEEKKN